MSRDFAGATDSLVVETAVVTTTPLTMACWAQLDNLTGSKTLIWLGDKDVSNQRWVLRFSNTAQRIQAEIEAGAANGVADTTIAPPTGTWFHAAAVYAGATDRRVFLNGGNKGTNATSVSPVGADRTAIGRHMDSTPRDTLSGLAAQVAVWNVALSDKEIADLANGVSPLHVQPGAIVWLVPLWGADLADISGRRLNVTATGTTVGASEPGVVLWPGEQAFFSLTKDITGPTAPTNFAANYPLPHVTGRVDLTWTNPSEAGNYRLNYRTDGTNPTSATDPSATLLQDWTAYTANSAGSKQATGLTNATRHRFALWHRDSDLNINGGAFVSKVPVTLIVLETPLDGATVAANPELRWATASTEAESGKATHYLIEASLSETDFTVPNLVYSRSSATDAPTGFEYEATSQGFAALASIGLAPADAGKDIRYVIPIASPGRYFWRVSPQQGGV